MLEFMDTHILVERQLSNETQGIFVKRPSVGVIKNINRSRPDLFRPHDLNENRPAGVIALLNGLEEILDVVVGFGSGQADSGICIHGLDAIIGLPMPLHVDIASILDSVSSSQQQITINKAYGFVQSVGMDTESVDVSQ